ncbi:MAG: enoyl-CoA hydratase/isomerase family protein [Candidatus Obscuribacterales bacterium]|nr:enoyl-CoA hydratase/isomerase family protein [Candidatus Obscuribacterales bacterium]
MAKDDDIELKVSGSIGRLILNRPESHNALSHKMWLDLPQSLDELQQLGAKIIVIEGEGDSFAAGADIMELRELDSYDDAQSNWFSIAHALNYLHTFKLPTVAAVHGPCHGGGCLLAVACDLRYASDNAMFSVPISRLGIALDDVNLGRLASLIGIGRAKELVFRAKVLNSSQALSWGLVNEVFPATDFDSKVDQILAEILANSPVSIREAKQSFNRVEAAETHDDNERTVVASFLGPEFKKRIQKVFPKE